MTTVSTTAGVAWASQTITMDAGNSTVASVPGAIVKDEASVPATNPGKRRVMVLS